MGVTKFQPHGPESWAVFGGHGVKSRDYMYMCGPRISAQMRFPLDGELDFYLKN